MVHAARWRRIGSCVPLLALATSLSACTRSGPKAESAIRLDEPEKSAASFSFPYYTDVVVVGDQVAAVFMTLKGPVDRNVVVRQSSDGGKTWSAPFVLNAPEYGDTISVAPKLAVEPGGGLLAVWQSRRNRAGQKFILARRSTDFGRTWGPIERLNSAPQSFPPSVATRDDGTVLVAYSDERNVERDIFVNRSTDGGATWLPADLALQPPGGKSESIGPWPVLGSGSDAWVIWEERRRGGPHLLAARSGDGGATWQQPVRVDPEGQPASPIWPMMVESGGRLTAVWTAGVVGDTMKSWLWVASSADGGATWSAPQLFYEGPAQATFQLVAHGPHLYLVWSGGGSEGGMGVYMNASDDGGATWRQPLDRPIRVDAGTGKTASGRPRIALAGDATIAVAWQEEDKRILLRASQDGGKTWTSAPFEIAAVDKDRVRFPIVAATDTTAWVVWEQWADMTGVRKTLADVDKLTPLDVYARKVSLR
ncbi:MAG TPA: sialidase family protein [Candidatus Binatia bacterium]|nr:sialidase family protein [Candidatus Binatia bacterium]